LASQTGSGSVFGAALLPATAGKRGAGMLRHYKEMQTVARRKMPATVPDQIGAGRRRYKDGTR